MSIGSAIRGAPRRVGKRGGWDWATEAQVKPGKTMSRFCMYTACHPLLKKKKKKTKKNRRTNKKNGKWIERLPTTVSGFHRFPKARWRSASALLRQRAWSGCPEKFRSTLQEGTPKIFSLRPSCEPNRFGRARRTKKRRIGCHKTFGMWVWLKIDQEGLCRFLVHVSTYQGSILVPLF